MRFLPTPGPFSHWPLHALPAALLAVCSIWIAGCTYAPPTVKAAVKPDKERKPAPEFSLKDGDGRTVKLSDYRGKVVLLNFWATWCGPCRIEIPWFVTFEQQFKDRGFAVLGVSMDEDGWESVKPYIEAKKVNYRVVMGNDSVAEMYGGVSSLPTTFLIDREGKIAAIHVGLVSKSSYEHDIDQIMGQSRSVSNRGDKPVLASGAN